MRNKKNVWFLCIVIFITFAACELDGAQTPPSYTVAYHANGGSGAIADSAHVYGTEKNLNPNAFTRTGYGFCGWAESPESAVKYTDKQSVKNLTKDDGSTVTLYAVWAAHPYTIVYDANGGSGTMEDTVHVYGEVKDLSANTFTRTSYVFAGWAASPTGPVVYTNRQSVANLSAVANSTVTLYAVWGSHSYTVVYNENGGSGLMADSVFTYDVSQNLRPNAFTRTGYAFAGWAASPTGSAVYTDQQGVVNITATPGATVTLYAAWNANTYTVVYNANGGSGAMANSNFTYGTAQNLQTNVFTRASHVFFGWAISETGTAIYTDGQSGSNMVTTAGATVTLYAVWDPITFVPGAALAAKLAWLEENALSNVNYTIEVSSNENITPATLSYGGRTNIGISIKSTGLVRFIGLSSNGSLFTVENGVILTLDNNITLQGRTGNNNSLVRVNSGGTLIMNTGSHITGNLISSSYSYGGGVYVASQGTFTMSGGEITGNTAYSSSYYSYGGGVYVASQGTFTMNGGEISGNTASAPYTSSQSYGGGVYVASQGTFTMSGGEITGNTASSGYSSYSYGGGVSVSGGTFTMNGGEISGNTASTLSTTSRSYGGGVSVSGGTFTMSGGTIYGYTAGNINSNAVMRSGTPLSNSGHAVYAGNTPIKRKETNAEQGVNGNLYYNSNTGIWSGEWDY